MNWKKQTSLKNFPDCYLGYFAQFIQEYDFEKPTVQDHLGETRDTEDFDIEWRSDIMVANDYSLLVPKSYLITNYVDNSYSDADTGHNTVNDVDYDVMPIMSEAPELIVDFNKVIKPWILEAMRSDEHPAYAEYVNVMTDKN